jgi:hypothetical protein
MRPRRSASSHSAGPHPVVAGGRRVAFVEDEVDDLQDRRQPLGQLGRGRQHERDALAGQGALGADDPLRDGRLRDQERPGDLLGGQAAEQAQRERHPRLGGQHRVAGDEHQPQQVVADVVVEGGVQVRLGRLPLDLQVTAELLELALVAGPAPQQVDGAVLGGGHEPGARVVRDA